MRPSTKFSCILFIFRELRVCWCGTPSLTRGSIVHSCSWASLAQYFSGPRPAGFMTIFYWCKFETPPTWRAIFCIYFPQEQGSPVIATGIVFLFFLFVLLLLYSLSADRTENFTYISSSVAGVSVAADTSLLDRCLETVVSSSFLIPLSGVMSLFFSSLRISREVTWDRRRGSVYGRQLPAEYNGQNSHVSVYSFLFMNFNRLHPSAESDYSFE
jgi:hypothetical protein